MSQFDKNPDYDEIFTQIAGRAGGLEPLLDSFMGFLNRRTDFYVEYDMNDSSNKESHPTMGFPTGVAERMLINSFRQYPMKKYSNTTPNHQQQTKKEIKNDNSNIEQKLSKTSIQTKSFTSSNINKTESSNSNISNKLSSSSSSSSSSSLPIARLTEAGKQIPIGNGGIGDNYYWTQTLNEITIYIDVVNGCRGKDIKCDIKPNNLKLIACNEVLIDGVLDETVRLDGSIWTLSTNSTGELPPQVIITLDKVKKTWWKSIIIGHNEIDTSKVDSSQKIDDYDEATQGAIRKIMFEQKQKNLGLVPQEDDFLTDEIKNLPGSPFLNEE